MATSDITSSFYTADAMVPVAPVGSKVYTFWRSKWGDWIIEHKVKIIEHWVLFPSEDGSRRIDQIWETAEGLQFAPWEPEDKFEKIVQENEDLKQLRETNFDYNKVYPDSKCFVTCRYYYTTFPITNGHYCTELHSSYVEALISRAKKSKKIFRVRKNSFFRNYRKARLSIFLSQWCKDFEKRGNEIWMF